MKPVPTTGRASATTVETLRKALLAERRASRFDALITAADLVSEMSLSVLFVDSNSLIDLTKPSCLSSAARAPVTRASFSCISLLVANAASPCLTTIVLLLSNRDASTFGETEATTVLRALYPAA